MPLHESYVLVVSVIRNGATLGNQSGSEDLFENCFSICAVGVLRRCLPLVLAGGLFVVLFMDL